MIGYFNGVVQEMTADKKQTDALKTWLESLGATAPEMIDSVLPLGKGVDWREAVLASVFDPAATTAARMTAVHANDESKPAPQPQKPKRR